MQSASPLSDSSADMGEGPGFEAVEHQALQSPQRVPHPPSAARPSTAPHFSLKTTARSIAMVQRVLHGLSGHASNNGSLSQFVQEGISLQQGILEEMREKSQALDSQRRTEAASTLAWSRRSDDILDGMVVLEGVAQEMAKKADAHVAELTARQAEREKELIKVAAKAQKDAKLLMERTNAQLEVMRLATQTIVRYASVKRAHGNASMKITLHAAHTVPLTCSSETN